MHDPNIKLEAGLDIKLGLSNNWTADNSLNTDFAQVEADDQQVNLTRFSLFFPEKRLFFQERSGVFDFNIGRSEKIFYSRKIGIDEDGNPIRILGGARLVGRTGDWDIGVLDKQTALADTLHSEFFFVGRVLKTVINENSNAGFIITNRNDFHGNHNTGYGLDATIRVKDQLFLSTRWAQTFTNDLSNSILSFDPSKFWVSFGNRSQRAFTFGASISGVGKDYDPQLGFETRNEYIRLGWRAGYNWFPGKDSNIFKHGFTFFIS